MSSGSRALVGLLSEPARLKVTGALALGATTAAEVVGATGLDAREVAAALRRLESGGLVSTERGRIVLHEDEFKETARAEAPPPPTDEDLATDGETAAVLRAFVPHGRIQSMPVSRAKRRLLLEHLARLFEPGVRYAERDVNRVLSAWHDDHAMLRRYLFDEGLVDRKDGIYWRIGGYLETQPGEPEPGPEQRPWHPRIGAYALAERDGSVLLTRLSRGDMQERWNLPGGGSDFGERPVDTLHRELYEETGLSGRVEEILDVDAFSAWRKGGPDWFLAVIYRVTITGGTLGVTESGGSSDLAAWVPLAGLDPATLTPRTALVVQRFTGR